MTSHSLIACFIWLSGGCFAQSMTIAGDSAARLKNDLDFCSMGIGYGTGFICSGSYTHMYGVAGISFSVSGLMYRADYLPDDYTGFFHHNNLYTIAFRGILGGQTDQNGKTWMGLEVGPSYVNFREEVETPNPNYTWLYLDKYLRDNLIYHTVGLSGRLKLNLILSTHAGLEFAFGFNLNRYKSSFGFEGGLVFGWLK